jgi:hypothetical protein
MSKEKLTEILNNLRQELENTDLKDVDIRNKLHSLVEDLDSQLKNNDNPDIDDFTENISNMIEQFEIEHPGITELLSKLSIGLSNMGI